MVTFPACTVQAPRRGKYRRRGILLISILSVAAYAERVEDGIVTPVSCPDGCQGRWWAHSRFQRQWIDESCVVFQLTIFRKQCSECRGVWSLFPAFVWYRFRFSYRLIQASCWSVLAGISPVRIVAALESRVSSILVGQGRTRIPAENTIRSWVKWLGNPLLETSVRWTLSLIAQICPKSARAVVPELAISGKPGPSRIRKRAERFLKVCSALYAVQRGASNLFRRSPYQLRDWAATLFCERRQVLARPP